MHALRVYDYGFYRMFALQTGGSTPTGRGGAPRPHSLAVDHEADDHPGAGTKRRPPEQVEAAPQLRAKPEQPLCVCCVLRPQWKKVHQTHQAEPSQAKRSQTPRRYMPEAQKYEVHGRAREWGRQWQLFYLYTQKYRQTIGSLFQVHIRIRYTRQLFLCLVR